MGKRTLSDSERHYLLTLVALAEADGRMADAELAILEEAAKRAGASAGQRLAPHDLEQFDAQQAFDRIREPEMRRRLLDDMLRLAQADGTATEAELRIIQTFAVRWQLEPPAAEGIQWGHVRPLADDELAMLRDGTRRHARASSRLMRTLAPENSPAAKARRKPVLVIGLIVLMLAGATAIIVAIMQQRGGSSDPAAEDERRAERQRELLFEANVARHIRELARASSILERDRQRVPASVNALVAMGAPAVPHLVAALPDTRDSLGRATMADVIVTIGEPRAEVEAALIAQLERETEPQVQRALLGLLGRMKSERALELLTRWVQRDDLTDETLAQVLSTLQRFGREAREAAPAVEMRLSHPSLPVRHNALMVLRDFGIDAISNPHAVANLLLEAGGLREQARAMMIGFGERGVPALVRVLQQPWTAANRHLLLAPFETIIELGPTAAPTVPALVTIARDDASAFFRDKVLECLMAIGPAAAGQGRELVVESLAHSNADVRATAVTAVARLGMTDELPRVMAMLGDQQTVVADAVARTLGTLGDNTTVSMLMAKSVDAEAPIEARIGALRALGEFDQRADRVIPHLIEMLASDEFRLRHQATVSLARFGERAIRPLEQAMETADSTRADRLATALNFVRNASTDR